MGIQTIRDRAAYLAQYEDEIQLVGFDTCGGCAPNDTSKVVDRATRLRDRGAEVIHLSTCMMNLCPWAENFREAISTKVGTRVELRVH